jgi:hypothetical protein
LFINAFFPLNKLTVTVHYQHFVLFFLKEKELLSLLNIDTQSYASPRPPLALSIRTFYNPLSHTFHIYKLQNLRILSFLLSVRSTSIMDSYPIHLALAALLGASFAAISAYYMHHKTLSQLIEFTQSIDRKKDKNKRLYRSYQRLIEGSTGTGDGVGDGTNEEADEQWSEEADAAASRSQNLPSSLPRLKLIHPGMA